MKYIIMADGKGTRWNNYHDIPKHFIEVGGETLLARTVRLLQLFDAGCKIIITSHDSRYEIEGATRHEPSNNVLEIDRFTAELVEDNVCFLYGDTYYSDSAIQSIVSTKTDDLMFFGNEKSIVAVKVRDAKIFRHHVNRVRTLFLQGKIKKCIGWQVYQSFMGMSFEEKKIAGKYVYMVDGTRDFNSPQDYEKSEKKGR